MKALLMTAISKYNRRSLYMHVCMYVCIYVCMHVSNAGGLTVGPFQLAMDTIRTGRGTFWWASFERYLICKNSILFWPLNKKQHENNWFQKHYWKHLFQHMTWNTGLTRLTRARINLDQCVVIDLPVWLVSSFNINWIARYVYCCRVCS